jgi:hypothetical protein
LDHIDGIRLRSSRRAIHLHADRIDDVVAHAASVDRKRRLNRLVELKSKVMMTAKEHDEIQYLERMFKPYSHNLATTKAQEHARPISKNDRSNFEQSFNGARDRWRLREFNPTKRRLLMSYVLRMATVTVMLGFAATGVTQAHPTNYRHHAGYAGSMSSQAPRELWPWNVPGRSVAGVASQFNNPGPQIKGYGCLAHPDYGLYTPHFC